MSTANQKLFDEIVCKLSTAYTTCYLLNETSLSLANFDLPTNCCVFIANTN